MKIDHLLDKHQALMDTLYLELWPLVNNIVKDDQASQDVMQDSFIKLFQNIDTIKNKKNAFGYIAWIFRNSAIDCYRKKQRSPFIQKDYDDDVISIDPNRDSINREFILKCIQEEIDALPPSQQKIFKLYYGKGLSHPEVAEQLNIHPGTSKSQVAKAKQTIQKKLEERFGTLDNLYYI